MNETKVYIVTSAGRGRTVTIRAKDSTQAKRKACKHWGIKPSDTWCGMSSMTAKQKKKGRK